MKSRYGERRQEKVQSTVWVKDHQTCKLQLTTNILLYRCHISERRSFEDV